MTDLVFYLAVFLALGVFFLFIHLVIGRVVRPARPVPEKLTIYECGEPTIGSAWIQFDLRYYVVALLFVIFDVEVAFFFPWALVFGKATTLADPALDAGQRAQISRQLAPEGLKPGRLPARAASSTTGPVPLSAENAAQLSWVAFVDILIFFGVLLVGFAYLWRRGDIDWVRSTRAERLVPAPPSGPSEPEETGALVGSGQAL
jgi:NADH-quinone oxidoreductase subunit A